MPLVSVLPWIVDNIFNPIGYFLGFIGSLASSPYVSSHSSVLSLFFTLGSEQFTYSFYNVFSGALSTFSRPPQGIFNDWFASLINTVTSSVFSFSERIIGVLGLSNAPYIIAVLALAVIYSIFFGLIFGLVRLIK